MADAPRLIDRIAAIAREATALGDLALLMRDPIYRGEGLPRGHGRLVGVIPGLFANDVYLVPMRRWLERLGYRPSGSGVFVNAGCPNRLIAEIHAWLEQQKKNRAEPVALIGHSRGGILARALAAKLGPEVSHLVLLGSPVAAAMQFAYSHDGGIAGGEMHPLMQASNAVRRLLDPSCEFPSCGCDFVASIRHPLAPETTVLSIYSREDPIVPPVASIIEGARNVEVHGTHAGLAYNPAVYREIARALAA